MDTSFELSAEEINLVDGGAFWVVIGGLVAFGEMALAAYKQCHEDGRCHLLKLLIQRRKSASALS